MNRTFWVATAAGAVICTYGDRLHATHGVLGYPHPVLGPQAWWVPALFVGASAAAILSANQTRKVLGAPRPRDLSARRVAADALAFVAAYVSTSFAHALPSALLAILFAFWVVRMLTDEPRWMIVFSLAMAGCGTAFEATWSALGFFDYQVPDFAGVPRWLPAIYLHAAPLAARIGALVEVDRERAR